MSKAKHTFTVAAKIMYDGSAFSGSQSQKHGVPTVADELAKSLKKLGIESKITLSGRTDAGVHAIAQVVSFEAPHFWGDLYELKGRLNNSLPDAIKVRKLWMPPNGFHPRYSAKSRTYSYILSTALPNPFLCRFVCFHKKFDFAVTSTAIKLFEGEHDFAMFKKEGGAGARSVRLITKARLYKKGNFYIFQFESSSFLRSQIRMMVGFLLALSDGKLGIKELKEQLHCAKKHCTTLAPPNGLYLMRVSY